MVLIFNGLRHHVSGEDVSTTRPDLLLQNLHRIRFMEFKINDVTDPIPEDSAAYYVATAFFDPWGTPYSFAFDNGIGGVYHRGPGNNGATPWPVGKAGDGIIIPPFLSGSGREETNHTGFVFFSNGPDQRTGTPETAKDDIRSWK